ncbi:hypothetical protein ACM0A0_24555 [Mycobacteroides abscessus subsp. abscessus]|uniref:hypothetical protein n=1 Tax=Mycobacteroides abscessus TaxID=36809 RepID=UPI0039F020F9
MDDRYWLAILIKGAVTLAGFAMIPVTFMKCLEFMQARTGGERINPPASPAPPPFSSAPGSESAGIPWAAVMLVVLAVAVVGAAVLLVRRYRRNKARSAAARAAQVQRWAKGVQALNTARQGLIDFENDPLSVRFTRPLLADVNEGASAKFYTALGEADALHTEVVPHDDSQISEFVTAALAAENAWGAANENALRKARLGIIHGGRVLLGEDKRKLAKAQNLISQALDPASTLEFAANALTKAQELLDAVGLVIPERLAVKTAHAIESIHRRELMPVQA